MVEVPDEESEWRFKSNKRLKEKGLKIESAIGKTPKMIMYDVDSALSEDLLKELMFQRNFKYDFLDFNDFDANIKFSFKKGPKDKDVVHWVIEVPPELRKIILNESERIYIDRAACKVRDFTLVTRCFQCQMYGHIGKYCKGKKICGHCGEEGHSIESCKNKKKAPRCASYRRFGKDDQHSVKDQTCPAYARSVEAELKKYNYKILQLNFQRGITTFVDFKARVRDIYDIILLQEPYQYRGEIMTIKEYVGFKNENGPGAAILVKKMV